MLLQESPPDRFETLLVVTHSRQPLQLFMIRIALAGLLFDNGGIQFFLRLEVAENDRFINIRFGRQIARCSSPNSLLSNLLHGCRVVLLMYFAFYYYYH